MPTIIEQWGLKKTLNDDGTKEFDWNITVGEDQGGGLIAPSFNITDLKFHMLPLTQGWFNFQARGWVRLYFNYIGPESNLQYRISSSAPFNPVPAIGMSAPQKYLDIENLSPGEYTAEITEITSTGNNKQSDTITFTIDDFGSTGATQFQDKWFVNFFSLDDEYNKGIEYRLSIQQQGFQFMPLEICLSRNSELVLNWKGSEDDILNPIIGSRCVIGIIDEIGNQFQEVFDADDFEYRVIIQKRNKFGFFQEFWKGYLVGDNYTEPFLDPPYNIQLNAIDGLGILKQIPIEFDITRMGGRYQLDLLLNHILSKTGVNLSPEFYFPMQIDGQPDTAFPVENISVTMEMLQKAGVKNYHEMLFAILADFQMRVFQFDGKWNMHMLDRIENTSDFWEPTDWNGNSTPGYSKADPTGLYFNDWNTINGEKKLFAINRSMFLSLIPSLKEPTSELIVPEFRNILPLPEHPDQSLLTPGTVATNPVLNWLIPEETHASYEYDGEKNRYDLVIKNTSDSFASQLNDPFAADTSNKFLKHSPIPVEYSAAFGSKVVCRMKLRYTYAATTDRVAFAYTLGIGGYAWKNDTRTWVEIDLEAPGDPEVAIIDNLVNIHIINPPATATDGAEKQTVEIDFITEDLPAGLSDYVNITANLRLWAIGGNVNNTDTYIIDEVEFDFISNKASINLPKRTIKYPNRQNIGNYPTHGGEQIPPRFYNELESNFFSVETGEVITEFYHVKKPTNLTLTNLQANVVRLALLRNTAPRIYKGILKGEIDLRAYFFNQILGTRFIWINNTLNIRRGESQITLHQISDEEYWINATSAYASIIES